MKLIVAVCLTALVSIAATRAVQSQGVTTLLGFAKVDVPVLPLTVLPSIVTTEYLIGFQAAALDTYRAHDPATGLMTAADLLDVTRFNSSGIAVLKSTVPDTWIKVARKDWPALRVRIAPYNGLTRWVAQIDAMLQ